MGKPDPVAVVGITHRFARAADAGSIAAIHAASWRDAYANVLDPVFLAGPVEDDRTSLWTERLRGGAPAQLVQIAETPDQEAVGFICAYRDLDPRWGSLVDNLHVLPRMRGRRIGERLLRSAARELVRRRAGGGLHLWVFEINEAGLRFYERLGGRVVERDVSRIPAAGRKPVLRLHWPAFDRLL